MSRFAHTIARDYPDALRSITLETLQVNVGLRCNMSCAHCHQASGPSRTESMSEPVLDAVAAFAAEVRPSLVDLTGGAPELHQRIRELISRLVAAGLEVQVRTNLTALLERECSGLAEFFAGHRVRLLASLPSFDSGAYARQRGDGLPRALAALRHLNALGYASRPDLKLVLAVNPDTAFEPGATDLDRDRWRIELAKRHGVRFNDAVLIGNMPLGRLGSRLGETESHALISAAERGFNAGTLPLLGCRRGIEIAWDGSFADCDFNLAAGMGLASETDDAPRSVTEAMRLALTDRPRFEEALQLLARRRVNFGDHCFICAAACGSS